MGYLPGDIISVTLEAELHDQVVINKLHYLIVTFGASADVETLLDLIQSVLINNFIPVQSADLTWKKMRIDNLTDLLSFDNRTISTPGLLVGAAGPSFIAGRFVKLVSSKSTRPGALRLAGITEDTISGQDWIVDSGDRVTAGLALGLTLDNAVNPPGEINAIPIIARKTSDGPPPIYTANQVTGTGASPILTSQVSRKQGVGE